MRDLVCKKSDPSFAAVSAAALSDARSLGDVVLGLRRSMAQGVESREDRQQHDA